jgi:predicted nucleotidyltransferase component of viral defense system
MRTITTQEYEKILGVTGESLTSLAEGVLEKDLLITDVLDAVLDMDGDGIGLVFCGGTCLAKAHGLIERMSEDVDFKVVVPDGLSRSARSRKLSHFKKRLVDTFEKAGFDVPVAGIRARDENNYVSMNLQYESRFPAVASLRPEIKVELNARTPLMPTVIRRVTSMMDQWLQAPKSEREIGCVSVEETLAEKVLSFLRRTAQFRSGRNRAPYDDRLVRHLYDVTAIASQNPTGVGTLSLPLAQFGDMVAGDARQFGRQSPEFEADPMGQMQAVLTVLEQEPAPFERDYREFVDDLVFGEPVSFAKAKSVFVSVSQQLLAGVIHGAAARPSMAQGERRGG